MEAILKEHERLEKKGLKKSVDHIQTIIDQLKAARDDVAASMLFSTLGRPGLSRIGRGLGVDEVVLKSLVSLRSRVDAYNPGQSTKTGEAVVRQGQ